MPRLRLNGGVPEHQPPFWGEFTFLHHFYRRERSPERKRLFQAPVTAWRFLFVHAQVVAGIGFTDAAFHGDQGAF